MTTTFLVDDRSPFIIYSDGQWVHAGQDSEYNGTTTSTSTPGATAQLTFQGTASCQVIWDGKFWLVLQRVQHYCVWHSSCTCLQLNLARLVVQHRQGPNKRVSTNLTRRHNTVSTALLYISSAEWRQSHTPNYQRETSRRLVSGLCYYCNVNCYFQQLEERRNHLIYQHNLCKFSEPQQLLSKFGCRL